MKIDISGIERMEKDFEYLNTHVLRVGMVSNPHLTSKGMDSGERQKDDKGVQGPKTVGEILSFHENPSGNSNLPKSPARAPIKITFRDKKAMIAKDVADFTKAMIDGKIDAERTLAFVGEKAVIHIKQTMINGLPPPLTEARKKQKRKSGKPADTPLIFRGQMSGSMRYDIVRSGL